jgi:hypothetical protein
LDALPQCKFGLFYDHRDNLKELSAKPYRGCSFDGPKEAKAPGRNNHPADSLYCGARGRENRYRERVMAEAGSDFHLPDGDPSRVLGPDSGCGARALLPPGFARLHQSRVGLVESIIR